MITKIVDPIKIMTPCSSSTCEPYSVQIYNEITPELQKNWLDFYLKLPHRSFIHSPYWHQAYLKSYGIPANNEMRVIVISQNTNWVAVLPFIYKSNGLFPFIKSLKLMFPTDMGIRDAAINFSSITADSIIKTLNSTLKNLGLAWHTISFNDIAELSHCHQLITNTRWPYVINDTHHNSYRIPCEGTPDTCLNFASKRFQKNAKNKEKILRKNGSLHFKLIDQPDQIESAYQQFLNLEDSGWKGRNGNATSLLCDTLQNDFYSSLYTPEKVPHSDAKIALLHLDDQLIAAKLVLFSGDTIHLMKITYDEAFKTGAPGNALIIELLRHYSDSPTIQYISFVTGPDWAARWKPETLVVSNALLFNNTMISKALFYLAKSKLLLKRLKRRIKNNEGQTDAS